MGLHAGNRADGPNGKGVRVIITLGSSVGTPQVGSRMKTERSTIPATHFSIPIWEVLNEVDGEHVMTPKSYTSRYDAIVSSVKRISPTTKFMGLALAQPSEEPGLV